MVSQVIPCIFHALGEQKIKPEIVENCFELFPKILLMSEESYENRRISELSSTKLYWTFFWKEGIFFFK